MKVNINKIEIVKDERNRVTESLVFRPHYRSSEKNVELDDNGIFSKLIFGSIHKCSCGKVVGEGFCSECGERVVELSNMPKFYIELPTLLPLKFANYDALYGNIDKKFKLKIDEIKELAEYKSFLYEDKIYKLIDNDGNEIDLSNFIPSKFIFGTNALKYIGVTDEWIKENMIDYVLIPHPIYRPLVYDGGNAPFITDINNAYIDLLKGIKNIKSFETFNSDNVYKFITLHSMYNLYEQITNEVISKIQEVKNSIISTEIISHPVTGAIRGVLLNRHDINEDVILIGDTFIETLFPALFKKYRGDMVKINRELINKDYHVLLNRAPTISHLSIVAMKPRIASLYQYGHIDDTDGALLENYNVEKTYRGRDELRQGDIEKFIDVEDDIDTIGLRCISINPIMADGLAADFDGDVLLVVALYGKDANKEARTMLPSKNFMNYANGTIRNKIIDHFIYSYNKS